MSAPTTENIQRRFIGITEAAARIGVSRSTLERWVDEKRVRAFQPQRKVLLEVQELDALVLNSAR